MLTFMEKKGRFCPVITCDVCGKRIRRADAAGVCGVKAGEPLRFFHADCDVDARHNTENFQYYEDLDVFLIFLEHNLRLNREDSRERATVLASLGAA
jgi:hypothetical protein